MAETASLIRETLLLLLLRTMRLCGMRSYRNDVIARQTITLDHASFDDMTIVECEVTYHGGGFSMIDSKLYASTWRFEGAAANTLELLRHLYEQDPEFVLSSLAADTAGASR